MPDKVTGEVLFSNDLISPGKHAARHDPVPIDDTVFILDEDSFLQLVVDFTLTSKNFKYVHLNRVPPHK